MRFGRHSRNGGALSGWLPDLSSHSLASQTLSDFDFDDASLYLFIYLILFSDARPANDMDGGIFMDSWTPSMTDPALGSQPSCHLTHHPFCSLISST